MFSLAFFAIFSISTSFNGKKDSQFSFIDSFSFATSQNKEIKLTSANQKTESLTSKFKRLSGLKKDELNAHKCWYYVHMDNKYISEAQKHVKIDENTEIIKDTFVLYLSPVQLEKISKFSLVKQIQPSDKIEKIRPFINTNILYVERCIHAKK